MLAVIGFLTPVMFIAFGDRQRVGSRIVCKHATVDWSAIRRLTYDFSRRYVGPGKRALSLRVVHLAVSIESTVDSLLCGTALDFGRSRTATLEQ